MVNNNDKNPTIFNTFKVVGLITSIVTIVAICVGAVTWISINMANNSVAILGLKEAQLRHETLISKNAEIISQQTP